MGVAVIIGIPYMVVGIVFGFAYNANDISYTEFLDGEPTFVRKTAYAVSPVVFTVHGIVTFVTSKPIRWLGKKVVPAVFVLIGAGAAVLIGCLLRALYVETWWYPLLLVGVLAGIFVLTARQPSEASKIKKAARAQQRRNVVLGNRISRRARPRRIRAFVRAVLEFAQLAFEALRVEKWKICPLVEISPTDRVTS
jgi:uncharacterized membrane protein